jgi:hypothetical protein
LPPFALLLAELNLDFGCYRVNGLHQHLLLFYSLGAFVVQLLFVLNHISFKSLFDLLILSIGHYLGVLDLLDKARDVLVKVRLQQLMGLLANMFLFVDLVLNLEHLRVHLRHDLGTHVVTVLVLLGDEVSDSLLVRH